MKKTKYYSWSCGQLAKGCKLCVEGQKLVLFITGICGQKCFYCPISEKKYGKDVIYANEWHISNPDEPKELIEEAELTEAKGAGITGGDPLTKIDRCVKYIRLLKSKFGNGFHIHLYTPLKFVTKENLAKLNEAGLDEIRFHLDLDDKKLWSRIELAKPFKLNLTSPPALNKTNVNLTCTTMVEKSSWDIGVEIPAIPGYEKKTKELVDYIWDKVNFLNLNELEVSDTQADHYKLGERNYLPKDEISYGVKDSEKTALEILKYAETKGLSTHYCTAKLKDNVQVKNRIIRRAKHVALKSDEITNDGLLIRGCVYMPDLAPGTGYREKLKNASEGVWKRLLETYEILIDNLKLNRNEWILDNKKIRIITSKANIKKFSKEIKAIDLIPAIVEEYPTNDAIEVNIDFL